MDPRVQKVITFLHDHPSDKFKISELSRQVNISQWHLTHLFQADIHMSPSEYALHLKFQAAAQLLAETFLSIKEVMTAVGIHDKSHFAKDFKRRYGMKPTEYRRQKTERSDD